MAMAFSACAVSPGLVGLEQRLVGVDIELDLGELDVDQAGRSAPGRADRSA
jgi:hypothetical protein